MIRYVSAALLFLSLSPAWALSGTERAVIWTQCWDAVHFYFPSFDSTQAARWEAGFDSHLRELTDAPDDVEFWRRLRMIIATLDEGRTTVQIPNGLPRTYDTVPIRFVLAGDKILVKQLGDSPEVEASGIRVGDELIAVDDRPVLDYMRSECAPNVSGSTEEGRLAEAAWRVLQGPADSMVRLVLRHPNGKELSVSLKRDSGADGVQFRNLAKRKGPIARKLSGSVIYFDIGQRFTAEAEGVLTDHLTKNPRADGVILDLRETKYGYVPLSVLRQLALFPLPMGAYRENDWTTVPKPYDPTTLEVRRYLRDVKGQTIEPSAEPYRGKVVVLVSGETAGPAEQFLEPLVFADRIALIGDTTAGAGGQSLDITIAPGAKLMVTARQANWENGWGNGHGFPPKVHAALTGKGLAAGRDDVLERAVAFIRERPN